MDTAALEIFRTVVEAGGVTRAAERLHRVQSNVTTRIRQLEQSLGVELFVRDGKRMVLTPAGQTLFDYARRMLQLADEARRAVQPAGRAGACASPRWKARRRAACRPCSPAITGLARRAARTGHLPDATGLAGLARFEVDCVFVAEPVIDPGLVALPAFEEELVVIAHAPPPIRSAADLETGTLLAFEAGCHYRARFEARCAGAGASAARAGTGLLPCHRRLRGGRHRCRHRTALGAGPVSRAAQGQRAQPGRGRPRDHPPGVASVDGECCPGRTRRRGAGAWQRLAAAAWSQPEAAWAA